MKKTTYDRNFFITKSFVLITLSQKVENALMRADTDLPYPDNIIRVTGKQSLTVRGPGQRQTLRRFRFTSLRLRYHFRSELFHHFFAFQVPDFNGRTVSGAQPISEINQ